MTQNIATFVYCWSWSYIRTIFGQNDSFLIILVEARVKQNKIKFRGTKTKRCQFIPLSGKQNFRIFSYKNRCRRQNFFKLKHSTLCHKYGLTLSDQTDFRYTFSSRLFHRQQNPAALVTLHNMHSPSRPDFAGGRPGSQPNWRSLRGGRLQSTSISVLIVI